MTRSFVPALVLLLFATSVSGQGFGKVEIFGGYSYVHTPSTSQGGPPVSTFFASANLSGWNGALEYKPIRWFGVVADFGGDYGTQQVTLGCEAIISCPPPPFNASAHVHSVLFGPKVSMGVGKFTPFVRGLVGVAHTNLTGSSSFSDTARSWAVGGGLDYRLVKGIAWRVQGDSLDTNFFGKMQKSFRLATGVVFNF
jgi:opacity protein-like surface antigen